MLDDLVGIAQIKRIRLSFLEIPLADSINTDSIPPQPLDYSPVFLLEIMDDDYIGKSIYRIPQQNSDLSGIEQQWDYWLSTVFPMLNKLIACLPNASLYSFCELFWTPTTEWQSIPDTIKSCIEIALWDYCMNRYFITGPEFLWRIYFNIGRIYFSSEDIDVMEEYSKKRGKQKVSIPQNITDPIQYINHFKNSVLPSISLELQSDHTSNLSRLALIRKEFPDAIIDLKWVSDSHESLEEIIRLGKEYDQYNIRFIQDFPLFTLVPEDRWHENIHHFKFSFALTLKPRNYAIIKNWMHFSEKSHRTIYVAVDPTKMSLLDFLSQLNQIDTHNGYWYRNPILWYLDCGMIDEWNAWVGLILATLPVPTTEHNILPPYDIQKLSFFKEFCRVTHGRFPSIPYRLGFYPDLDSNKIKLVTKKVCTFKLENHFASENSDSFLFRD